MSSHVVFVGDSTLDNVVWVKSQKECITAQLQNELGSHATVTNYAADGFTSHDTLYGNFPTISANTRQHVDPFPEFTGVFKPLEHLKNLHQKNHVTHVVLSVGGNDIREILGHMDELPRRVEEFVNNFPLILKNILEVTPNVIVMLQYRPSYHQDHIYGVYRAMRRISSDDPVATLNALMEVIYPMLFKLARDQNLAIIDLPNTFDIYDSSLYESQIEPSAKGGGIITEIIAHVIKSHDLKGKSKFYKKVENRIEETPNEGSEWRIGKTENSVAHGMLNMVLGGIVDFSDKKIPEEKENEELKRKIGVLREMGFQQQEEEIKRCLAIDGTVETAIATLTSSHL